jgi:hypothetical protein
MIVKYVEIRRFYCIVFGGFLSPQHGASSGSGWRNGLQLWRVAADKRQSVVLQLEGWAWGSQSFTVKHTFVTKHEIQLRTWTDALDKRPKRRNMDTTFGLWNVWNLYRAGSLMTVSRELSKYKLDLVGVQEVRWEGGGTGPAGEHTFLYGKGNENLELGAGFFFCITDSYQQLRGLSLLVTGYYA